MSAHPPDLLVGLKRPVSFVKHGEQAGAELCQAQSSAMLRS